MQSAGLDLSNTHILACMPHMGKNSMTDTAFHKDEVIGSPNTSKMQSYSNSNK